VIPRGADEEVEMTATAVLLDFTKKTVTYINVANAKDAPPTAGTSVSAQVSAPRASQ